MDIIKYCQITHSPDLLGLGCNTLSVCFRIFSVHTLVLSALWRRFSKWASSSVFSADPSFSSVNCNRKGINYCLKKGLGIDRIGKTHQILVWNTLIKLYLYLSIDSHFQCSHCFKLFIWQILFKRDMSWIWQLMATYTEWY